MSEQDNIKLVQQAYANYKSGDIQSMLDLLADDIEWELPEIENVPFSGKRRGREEVEKFFKSLADSQKLQYFEPREFIAQGDKVVVLGHYGWCVYSTNREFEGDWAHVFTIRGGKVLKMHEYTDTAAVGSAYLE